MAKQTTTNTATCRRCYATLRSPRSVARGIGDRCLRLERLEAENATARTPAPLTADDVTGDLPTVEDIQNAARDYEDARTAANEAARTKRKAEKVLKRVPDGQYGTAVVERYENSRQVADLDAIKAIFEANGLGDVPMKLCAPSLLISFAEDTEAATDHQLTAAA